MKPLDPNAAVPTLGGQKAFLVLYCLASFFLNCGPNTTTFIVPGESFPTRYRSTMNGVAAASGKLGAIISQLVIYGQLWNSDSLVLHKRGVMVVYVTLGCDRSNKLDI